MAGKGEPLDIMVILSDPDSSMKRLAVQEQIAVMMGCASVTHLAAESTRKAEMAVDELSHSNIRARTGAYAGSGGGPQSA